MNLSLKNVLKTGYVYCICVFLWEEKKKDTEPHAYYTDRKKRDTIGEIGGDESNSELC